MTNLDGMIENLVQEINNVRVGFLQLLDLEKLYKENKGDVDVYQDKVESFPKKLVLIRNWKII